MKMTSNTGRKVGVMAVALVFLALAVFRELVTSNAVLFMTDNNIGFASDVKNALPAGLLSIVWGGALLGTQGTFPVCLSNLLLWLMPLRNYVNWFHAIALIIASCGVAMFSRRRGCGAAACLMGVMATLWSGSSLTLIYSGHDAKYGMLAFAGLSLFLIEMAAKRKRMAWSVLAGGTVGMMFVEQQDVAFFMGLFLGAYAVYAILRENSRKWRALIVPLILMGGTALLVGGPNVLSGYMTQVKGVVAMSDESPRQKWDYCTCLLYTSPSPRDRQKSRMPSSA